MSETYEILGTVYLIPQRLLLGKFTLTGTFHESPLCGVLVAFSDISLMSALWYTLASLIQQNCLMSSIEKIGHISYICI